MKKDCTRVHGRNKEEVLSSRRGKKGSRHCRTALRRRGKNFKPGYVVPVVPEPVGGDECFDPRNTHATFRGACLGEKRNPVKVVTQKITKKRGSRSRVLPKQPVGDRKREVQCSTKRKRSAKRWNWKKKTEQGNPHAGTCYFGNGGKISTSLGGGGGCGGKPARERGNRKKKALVQKKERKKRPRRPTTCNAFRKKR